MTNEQRESPRLGTRGEETKRLSTQSIPKEAPVVKRMDACPSCGGHGQWYGADSRWACDDCSRKWTGPNPFELRRDGKPPGGKGRTPPPAKASRDDGDHPEPVAVVVTLADVPREEVDWEWGARLPRRRIVLVEGDPGVGKSWLVLAIATAITTGAPLPGQTASREPGKVLLLTAEDGVADTVRPRMEDMGADLQRVRVLTAMRDKEGNERHVSLVDDLSAVDVVLGEGGYKLLVVDPLNAYLGVTLDTHRDAALRAALTPLALLAERWGVIVLCIRHLTKGGRDKAIYRGQGNIAYTAAARVVFLVGENPDDPHERVMACIKNNLAPLPPALAFELTDGVFLWRGTTEVTAATLLRPDADEGERGALAEAEGFLRELLADGPMEVAQMEEERKAAGITTATLRRAKEALSVVSARQGGLAEKGRWAWTLPSKVIKDAKVLKTPHTVLLSTLEEDVSRERERDDHLSTPEEIDPTKMLTCSHSREMSPLVALAVDLGAKASTKYVTDVSHISPRLAQDTGAREVNVAGGESESHGG